MRKDQLHVPMAPLKTDIIDTSRKAMPLSHIHCKLSYYTKFNIYVLSINDLPWFTFSMQLLVSRAKVDQGRPKQIPIKISQSQLHTNDLSNDLLPVMEREARTVRLRVLYEGTQRFVQPQN